MGLASYVVGRGLSLFSVFLMSVFIFFIVMRVLPIVVAGGNPFEAGQIHDPVLAALRRTAEDPRFAGWINYTAEKFGLNLPLIPDQLLIYMKNVLTLEFGISIYSQQPVIKEIAIRLPYTLTLYVYGVIVPILLGYLVGVLALKYRGRKMDTIITLLSMASYILPSYIILLLIYYFLAYLPKATLGIDVFPLPVRTPSLSEFTIENIRYLLWYISPIYLAMTLAFFGGWAYYFRQLLVSEAEKDYVITARAKGVPESKILRREITPNVRPPILTSLAYTIPGIFGGSIILEYLASWPGIAYFSFNSFVNFDYPVIVAFYVISSLLLVISLFIADILIAILDPRVRIGERR
ncbi:MAG: ABC transporter permease [Sulfolobales archaeon]